MTSILFSLPGSVGLGGNLLCILRAFRIFKIYCYAVTQQAGSFGYDYLSHFKPALYYIFCPVVQTEYLDRA